MLPDQKQVPSLSLDRSVIQMWGASMLRGFEP